jgi:hypothetical protein
MTQRVAAAVLTPTAAGSSTQSEEYGSGRSDRASDRAARSSVGSIAQQITSLHVGDVYLGVDRWPTRVFRRRLFRRVAASRVARRLLKVEFAISVVARTRREPSLRIDTYDQD